MPGKIIPFRIRPRVKRNATASPGRSERRGEWGAISGPPMSVAALVEVHRCDQREALVVKGLFESEGIPVIVRSRIAHSVHPFTVGAQGEVALLVPRADADRSRRLLAV
jgi:hypothetical protein